MTHSSCLESPGIGHTRKDWTKAPVLFWPVGKYLIVYRVHTDQIEVLAVTQGSRDIPVLLRKRL
jgi:antitoxin ParD1/3/4/toxin ParE1/3/4